MFRFAFLVGASAVALAAGAADATNFAYTGSIQSFIAPTSGFYDVTALGAQGGDFTQIDNLAPAGGLGAAVSGRLWIGAGTNIFVVVGGKGGDGRYAGGGGGTFIYRDFARPLVIAGGGGGSVPFSNGAGSPGLATPEGGDDPQYGTGRGVGGQGGTSRGLSGGGAGWAGDGSNYYGSGSGGFGAPSFAGGAGSGLYGASGGFGGGGGGVDSPGYGGAGGGGGFSGGAGGIAGGGGGGSFLSVRALNGLLQTGVNAGNGSASITYFGASVPEPGTWATLLSGFGLIGSLLRWRRRKPA